MQRMGGRAPHLDGHEDRDDHGHDHGHDRGNRFVAAARELFVPHSHDAVDKVDDALENDRRGIKAVKVSFAALIVTAFVQVVIVAITGSVALLADTIHNFSDALTAIPLLVAFRLARRPANDRFTYGYRRAEDIAGLFIVAMIALSAVLAAWQAVDRLIDPRPIENLGVLFVAGVVGFAGNELVALYRIREGKAIGSAALVTDGYHARTDGFTSLAVALGALGVWAGFERADPVIGLLISVAIFFVLRDAARQIYYRLMDAVEPELVARVRREVEAVTGVHAADSVKVRWLGHRLVADIVVDVDAGLTVGAGHAVAVTVQQRLVERVAHVDEVHVHVHPDPLDADAGAPVSTISSTPPGPG